MQQDEGDHDEISKEKEVAATDKKTAEMEEKASNSDRSIQSLILKFGDDGDTTSVHSAGEAENTAL